MFYVTTAFIARLLHVLGENIKNNDSNNEEEEEEKIIEKNIE